MTRTTLLIQQSQQSCQCCENGSRDSSFLQRNLSSCWIPVHSAGEGDVHGTLAYLFRGEWEVHGTEAVMNIPWTQRTTVHASMTYCGAVLYYYCSPVTRESVPGLGLIPRVGPGFSHTC